MARAAAAPHDFSISKCPPNCVVSKVLSPIEPSRLSDYNLDADASSAGIVLYVAAMIVCLC